MSELRKSLRRAKGGKSQTVTSASSEDSDVDPSVYIDIISSEGGSSEEEDNRPNKTPNAKKRRPKGTTSTENSDSKGTPQIDKEDQHRPADHAFPPSLQPPPHVPPVFNKRSIKKKVQEIPLYTELNMLLKAHNHAPIYEALSTTKTSKIKTNSGGNDYINLAKPPPTVKEIKARNAAASGQPIMSELSKKLNKTPQLPYDINVAKPPPTLKEIKARNVTAAGIPMMSELNQKLNKTKPSLVNPTQSTENDYINVSKPPPTRMEIKDNSPKMPGQSMMSELNQRLKAKPAGPTSTTATSIQHVTQQKNEPIYEDIATVVSKQLPPKTTQKPPIATPRVATMKPLSYKDKKKLESFENNIPTTATLTTTTTTKPLSGGKDSKETVVSNNKNTTISQLPKIASSPPTKPPRSFLPAPESPATSLKPQDNSNNNTKNMAPSATVVTANQDDDNGDYVDLYDAQSNASDIESDENHASNSEIYSSNSCAEESSSEGESIYDDFSDAGEGTDSEHSGSDLESVHSDDNDDYGSDEEGDCSDGGGDGDHVSGEESCSDKEGSGKDLISDDGSMSGDDDVVSDSKNGFPSESDTEYYSDVGGTVSAVSSTGAGYNKNVKVFPPTTGTPQPLPQTTQNHVLNAPAPSKHDDKPGVLLQPVTTQATIIENAPIMKTPTKVIDNAPTTPTNVINNAPTTPTNVINNAPTTPITPIATPIHVISNSSVQSSSSDSESDVNSCEEEDEDGDASGDSDIQELTESDGEDDNEEEEFTGSDASDVSDSSDGSGDSASEVTDDDAECENDLENADVTVSFLYSPEHLNEEDISTSSNFKELKDSLPRYLPQGEISTPKPENLFAEQVTGVKNNNAPENIKEKRLVEIYKSLDDIQTTIQQHKENGSAASFQHVADSVKRGIKNLYCCLLLISETFVW